MQCRVTLTGFQGAGSANLLRLPSTITDDDGPPDVPATISPPFLTTIRSARRILAYSGGALSKSFAKTTHGEYYYRVRACNTFGCGGYRESAFVLVCRGGCQ